MCTYYESQSVSTLFIILYELLILIEGWREGMGPRMRGFHTVSIPALCFAFLRFQMRTDRSQLMKNGSHAFRIGLQLTLN